MRTTTSVLTLLAATAIAATPAFAQQTATVTLASAVTPDSGRDSTTAEPKKSAEATAMSLLVPQIQIQHIRPNDQRGINVYESPKQDDVMFTGFKLAFGAAFAQQFQALGHTNEATSVQKVDAAGKPYNANQLIQIGHGPNNAVANLYLNAQLAQGIRVALTGYLSARHHN